MKAEPIFSPWAQSSPPVSQRWITAGFLLSGCLIGAYAWRPGTLPFSLCIAAVFCLIVLLRVLFWRFSVHNRERYEAETAIVSEAWWRQHRRHISLQQTVLIGPVGSAPAQWQQLIEGNMRKPEPAVLAIDGKVLRLARIFNTNDVEREIFLAQLLALQWREQEHNQVSSPIACYWLGSDTAWQTFRTQTQVSFPGLVLPEVPQPWNGLDTLDRLIDEVHHGGSEAVFLCAGCHVTPATAGTPQPAGEVAVLWLVGNEGSVQLSRGEYFDVGQENNLMTVAVRAQQQCELNDLPPASFIFFHPQYPEIHQTGWNTQQHIQNDYWGDIGGLESMVVQTLAALYVKNTAQPCGWIGRDISHTLALGIVKPYGKGQ